jgi:putative protein-disulfide isomerase
MTDFEWLNTTENSIIYVGDTMCSWCYGFAPELYKFIEHHPDFKVRVVNGGLRPHNTEKVTDMVDFLKSHWVEINERTGQPFSYDILENKDFVYDTEPASRAVVVARIMKPEIELDFFSAVQTGFYRDSKDTRKIDTFLEIAEAFKLDVDEFKRLFELDETKHLTKIDFQLAAEMGIRGFPSVVLKIGKEFTLLSNGFREVKDLEEIFTKVVVNSEKS